MTRKHDEDHSDRPQGGERQSCPSVCTSLQARLRVPSPLCEADEQLVRGVIGCGLRVHAALGPGFTESVYHRSLELELTRSEIDFASELSVPILYRGVTVGAHRLDLLVSLRLVVELKAVEQLQPVHRAQVLSYLRASGYRVGLLLNFGAPTLGIRRLVN